VPTSVAGCSPVALIDAALPCSPMPFIDISVFIVPVAAISSAFMAKSMPSRAIESTTCSLISPYSATKSMPLSAIDWL